jgi:hypothetical protein
VSETPEVVVIGPAERDAFSSGVRSFLTGLRDNYASLTVAQPEDQLKAPVGDLIAVAGHSVRLQVLHRTETKVDGVAGRPDLGVDVSGLPTGNVELKAPGNGADPNRFSDKRSRDQWDRFKALPNLIYTDGRQWALYRYGDLISGPVDLGVDVDRPGGEPHPDVFEDLLGLLVEFLGWKPIVPSSPRALAQMLAPVARLLRDEVLADIATGGILKALANEWRATLFPDATDKEFADGYAQTFTYALLLARLEGAQSPLQADNAAAELDNDHALLAQALRVIAQQDVRDAISMPVGLLERLIGAVDAGKLAKSSDPWLYFYEDFLAAYDPVQRNNRGVYYTPLELVGYQVRTADSILKTRLGKATGFGHEEVVVLDPAAGTGTYPLTVVAHSLAESVASGGQGLGAEVASRLGRNVNAFEILVGPYAVTHLRLARALTDAGGELPTDGVRVFLTDTLTEPALEGFAREINIFQRKLAAEQERASLVKSAATRVTVVIGNPPWDRDASGTDSTGRRKGGMIRYSEDGNIGLLKDFLEPLPIAVRADHSMSLYNDYVYFWRWALWKACEQQPGPAIVSLVTASSFVSGPGFAAMREQMRRAFDEIWITDLGGEGRGPLKSDNVFDGVLTPNAVAVGVRLGDESNRAAPAAVRYRRVSGDKAAKLKFLNAEIDLTDSESWELAGEGWGDSFIPAAKGDYTAWPAIDQIFPWTARGIQFSRSWPVSEDKGVLEARWSSLLGADKINQKKLLKESEDVGVDKSAKSFLTGDRLPAISGLAGEAQPDGYRRIGFRSFDRQWALADGRVIDRPRPALWGSMNSDQVFFTSVLEGTSAGPTLVAHAYVPDLNATNNRGGLVFPLYRSGRSNPNLASGLLAQLESVFGVPVSADQVASYMFGLTGTGAFVSRFRAELQSSGLRVPITTDLPLFEEVAAFGADLIWWSTYGERNLMARTLSSHALPAGSARASAAVQSPGGPFPSSVHYDENTRTLTVGECEIYPVSPAVWQFEVSGLPVVSSWLGYRMKKRAGKTSSDLDKVRPRTWSLTGELLDLLSVVEHIVSCEPDAIALIDRVVTSPLLSATTLPPLPIEETTPPSAIAVSPTMF